jgi:circadian clock protein KaiC
MKKSEHKKKLSSVKVLEKIPTGITGFDEISHGGVPSGRTTLISGTTGSGKTIFAAAFLYHGLSVLDEAGVFVTFEESPQDIMRNMLAFGWDLEKYLKNGKLVFVDISTQPSMPDEMGPYDMSGLITRLTHAVKKVGAKRVVIDTISALLDRLKDQRAIRAGLYQAAAELKSLGVTTILTSEHEEQSLGIVKATFMEYVSDNVIVLHSFLQHEFRKRTIEILKYRGTGYDSSATPVVIDGGGFFVYPRPHAITAETGSLKKLNVGVKGLDKMLLEVFTNFQRH